MERNLFLAGVEDGEGKPENLEAPIGGASFPVLLLPVLF